VCVCVCVCLGKCAGLQRYLVAVGGMALQQQRREQLDQALSAEDTALLQQKGVLEPAIPQPSSIGREAGAVGEGGGGGREREAVSLSTHSGRAVNNLQLHLLAVRDALIIRKTEIAFTFDHEYNSFVTAFISFSSTKPFQKDGR